ncbi:HNH/endonuclease VII fold toxin-2 domain-containing protein [Acidovorax sp. PRC11]|uniref:HNH/endonuclease VII fold toxin-2 domain-containing protein n=1 Tax=Acidovorax sp. PRC11 TaxID=2962592 RepID=UPI003857C15D
MFEGCPGYEPSEAPTVCVEGTNNTHGSHGMAHNALMVELSNFEYPSGSKIPKGAEITKESAINAGVSSVRMAFPESGCDERCLKAQLHAFYDRLNCVPKSHPGVDKTGQGGGGSSGPSNSSGSNSGVAR